MKGQLIVKKLETNLFLIVLAMIFASGQALAQVPVDENGNPLPVYAGNDYDASDAAAKPAAAEASLTAVELEDLVGPVALYPDDLLAIVLPASTYPLEIVQAARFLERLELDSTLKPDESWDESIVALLNYPDVVRMLDEDIDWTWRLGEAVISQQSEVIAAVEAFRDRAYAAGNLKTDEYQEVNYDDEGVLEIVPVSEEIIYVPYYEPAEVVVYQPRPVYYYYPDPYPVYYYPYPAGHRFHSGYFWGVTTAFSIGWSNHYLHVYHPSYWGHPYYGRYYYGHYYRRPSITVYNNWYVNNSYNTSRYRYRDGDHWRPRSRAGSRPNEPRVNNYHYSPNGSNNSRDYTVSRRDRLEVRNDGRMNLNLRERDTGRAAVNTSNQGSVATNRQTASNGRTSSGSNERRNTATRSITDTANRNRVATNNARTSRNRSQDSAVQPDISFRDRSRDNAATNNPAATRAATTRQNRQSAASASGSRRTTATPPQNQGRVRTNRTPTPPRATAPRATTPRATAPRATTPRATAPRATPPRATAPRATTPSVRQRTSAPRPTTPAIQQRAPAPRSVAPPAQQRAPAAPRDNSRSSRRGDAGAARSRQSAPSSRPRVRSNNHD